MDAPLNTSVILLVAVALWLIWVGPYMLRGRKRALAADAAPTVPQPAVAFPAVPAPRQQVSMYMEAKQSQEIPMKTTSTSAAAAPSAKPLPSNPKSLNRAKQPAKSPAPLKIHYGRTFIALVALLALLATAVSGVLRLLGIASGLIPVGAAVVFIGSLALLRALAVRSRKARLNAAFRAAMGPTTTAASRLAPRPSASASRDAASTGRAATSTGTHAGTADAARAAADRPAVAVFDAAAGGSAAPAAPVRAAKPLTAAELRRAALAVAAKGAADAQVATTETVGELETWQPVEVPKPSYVAAAKADRPAPAPLELPEAPKPSGKTSIKATEAAAVVSKATEAAAAEKAAADTAAASAGAATGTSAGTAAAPDRALSAGPAPSPAGKARPVHGLSNLDVVLQRRRA